MSDATDVDLADELSLAADRLLQKARGGGRLRNHESNEVEMTAGDLYAAADLMFRAAEALLSTPVSANTSGKNRC